ncbi:unnamed protein product [Sphenostylis stenocarpa]|uniref:Uncharacterized protein n=1 Tax=Sphenostylis stenocarpa TaxID=92480 RepID=A0AA86SS29_9FABA|nr:unnamed protein product [Sphenostylis stenocarpa]
MEKNTVDYSPLVTPRGDENASKTASSSLVSPVKGLFSKWTNLNRDSLLGFTGSIFVVFTAPLLIIAFLAIAHLNLTGEDQLQGKKSSKYPSIRLWTFPVLIRGPFGVVSAAEHIGIPLKMDVAAGNRFRQRGTAVSVEGNRRGRKSRVQK